MNSKAVEVGRNTPPSGRLSFFAALDFKKQETQAQTD